jgi:hypothetical protein
MARLRAADTARRIGLVAVSESGIMAYVLADDAMLHTLPPGRSGHDWLGPRILASWPILEMEDDTIAARIAPRMKAGHDVGEILVIGSKDALAVLPGNRLAAKVKARAGISKVTLRVLTRADQARLSFDWIVPANRRSDALLIDLGEGDTQLGWYDGARWRAQALPYGTRTLAGAVKRRWPEVRTEDFAARAAQHHAETAVPLAVPQRSAIWLTGGIVEALAAITHPADMADDGASVALTPADFTALRNYVTAGTPYGPGLPAGLSAAQQARIRAKLSVIRETYNAHQIAAGASLGEGVMRQIGLDQGWRLLFPRFADNGWGLQYLINRPRN